MRSVPARLAAAAATALLACASARMQVDPVLTSSSDAYAVTGANPRRWDRPLAFGPYRTGPVRDGGTLGWSVELLALGGLSGAHRPFAWRIEGPGGTLEAECHERRLEARERRGLAVDLAGVRGEPVFACAFRAPSSERGWTLAIRATGRSEPGFAGELREAGGAAVYSVRSTHALEGSPIPLGTPAGWSMDREGTAVAAVEVLGGGRVLLTRGTPDVDPIAAASVALLLFTPEPD